MPVILDPDGTFRSIYPVRGFPTVIIIDKKGIIRYIGHSFNWNQVKLVNDLLEEE